MSNSNNEFYLPIEFYTNNDYDKLRCAYILLIASLIKPHLIDEDINDYKSDIINIEKSCYLHTIEIAEYELILPEFSNKQFEQLYRTNITRITKNLDINSEVGDDYLINLIINRSINIDQISKMTPEALCPSKNIKLLEELNNRREQKVYVKVSSDYTCPRCYRKEATTRSIQTRSLDEGETLFATCNFCSHRWKP